MFRLHNSATVRSLLFGLGIVSVMVLGALWVAVQREHLPGVSPSRDVFRLELRSAVNGDPLSRKDVAMLVETALPGAALVTLRRVEARLFSGGKDLGKAWIGVLSDDAVEVLGLGLNSGRWWADRGKASREWVVSPALNARFRLQNLAPEAQVRIEARGAVDEAGTQLFSQVGEVSSAVTGLGYGIPVDAWVKESEWPNWLFPSDVPERILDMVYPLSMVMLSPREKLDASEIADRLQRAAGANGEVITVDVSKGSARDPSRTPKAQAQTLVYTLIAVATLFVCIFGYLFLWALRLVRGFKDQVIRYMLGEPRGAASRRALAEIGVEVLASAVFSSFLAIGVIHVLAIRPPFESFALSEFLLSDSEVIEVASLALLLGLLIVLVGHVLSERMLSMVAVRKSNGGASSIHISVLVGGSALAMMVSIGMGLLTFFAQRALEHRDYGFDAQHLVQVTINRDREQLVDAVFDPQTSASVLSDLRDGLSGLSGVVSVSASSKHPLQGYSGGLEYKLPGDGEDARRFGNIVHLDSGFFRTLGVSSEMAEMSDGLHPQLFRGIGVDHSFDAAREISGGGRITLLSLNHQVQHPTSSRVQAWDRNIHT